MRLALVEQVARVVSGKYSVSSYDDIKFALMLSALIARVVQVEPVALPGPPLL